MNEVPLHTNQNPVESAAEKELMALNNLLQASGDGTAATPISSDNLLQYFINDMTKLLNAAPEALPGVITRIKERIEENHHEKLIPLYRIAISFVVNKLDDQRKLMHQARTIDQLQQVISQVATGDEIKSLVSTDQISLANKTLLEAFRLQEDVNALEEPTEKIDFMFEGNAVYVWNGQRDRIFRYWYQHRERHHILQYSNRQIAKEINAELGISFDYAAKIVSQINRWFVCPVDTTWLNGDYIHRTQMYFKSLGYSFQLNFCHHPPTLQQIQALGQQLHVSAKQQTEE